MPVYRFVNPQVGVESILREIGREDIPSTEVVFSEGIGEDGGKFCQLDTGPYELMPRDKQELEAIMAKLGYWEEL